jgi:hypothetical protein
MRRAIIALLGCAPIWAWSAAQPLEGRWEGRILIPGRETPVVVDLARSTMGAWAGSIILPGLGIKGAPLTNIVAGRSDVAFDLGNVLSTPTNGPVRVRARLDAADRMSGEMNQGGNIAKLSLRKTGPAQVDVAPRSTAVARALEDQWIGEFELGGYPRHVTLTLQNHANAAATATFVIVGKQTNNLPVSLVTEEDSLLRIESATTHVNFEGRLVDPSDELSGTIELGPLELPVVLRRAARRAS